jgi:hypothetical protein
VTTPPATAGVVITSPAVVICQAVVRRDALPGPMRCSPVASLLFPMSCPAVGHAPPVLPSVAAELTDPAKTTAAAAAAA